MQLGRQVFGEYVPSKNEWRAAKGGELWAAKNAEFSTTARTHLPPFMYISTMLSLYQKKKGVKICENTQNSLYICLKDLRMKSLGKLHTEIGNSRTYYSTKKKKENMKSYLYIFKCYIFLNWILWFQENLKATFNSREYQTSVYYQFPRSIV